MKVAPLFKITIEAHSSQIEAKQAALLKCFPNLERTPILKGVNPINDVCTRCFEEVAK